ncbi:hypothetical protein K457DRAFT_120866 [Linnemannia elongata AG-77]|uniref:Uncharacterized protein n=1 Tax=Linnemannia elongata AG-77 TaxID=1314771 RepID=A0A197KDB4_9FUNG|nr:hypothetical protein K457DRAFT_120866 [Linnemannia elongata AG-77]
MTPPLITPGSKMKSFVAMATIVGAAMIASVLIPTTTADATTDSPGAIILGGLGSLVPKPAPSTATSYLTPGMANITSIGVFVNTSTLITFTANGTLKNPFSETPLPLGQAGFSIAVDGQNIANITAYNLTLPGGTGPVFLNATITLPEVSPSPAIQVSLNNLVTNLLGRTTPSGPPPVLVISDFTLSGTNMGLAPITIPIQSASSSLPPTPDAIPPPPVIGLWGILNPGLAFEAPTLKKLVVKTVSGAKLILGADFEWNNPLNIALDIPFITADLGFNGTRVATIGMHAVQLAPGRMAADTLVEITFNSDVEASVQLSTFVRDFLGGQLSQTVNVGNLSFGNSSDPSATGTVLNTLFSGVTVDLPLLGYNTIVLQQLVLGLVEPLLPFPIDLSNFGGSGSSLLQYIQSVAISTAPGHTLLLQPKIQLPFPFLLDLNIPYLALDVDLNDNLLGQLFLTNLVGSGQGKIAVSVGIGLVFREPNPSVPATVAQLLDGISTGAPNGINVGVGNLAIGVSPSDAINTLSGLFASGPISSIITGSLGDGSSLQTNITVVQNAINIKIGSLFELEIHGASINVLPNNLVTAAVKLEVFLGLPVVANIGYFGIQAQLDGTQLAGLEMNTGLSYAGGRVQMDAGIALNVGTGPAISSKVAALVNAIIAKQAVTNTFGISGIVIGDSSSDTIDALSGLSVQLPLGGLFGSGTSSGGFFNGILAKLGFNVADLSLSTIPNAGLRVGARATFSNPIPISVSVPYIGISGGLDHVDLAALSLNDLAFIPGANSLQADIDLNFNNAIAAQAKITAFLAQLLGGQLGATPEQLTLHNLRIGASPSDYFDLLSQIDVAYPSKDFFTKANLDALSAMLGIDFSKETGNIFNNLKVGAISLGLDKAPAMDLSTSIALGNVSLKAAVDIGYFGFDLALDSHALGHVDIPSINISTSNNQLILAFKAVIAVEDTPAVQTDIANIVAFISSNTTATSPISSLMVSKPVFGVSTSDNIQTFALIQYPFALNELLTKARVSIAQLFSGTGGLNTNNWALSGLVLDLNSPSIASVQGGLHIKGFSLPIDLSISYIGASLGLDAIALGDLTIPSLALTSTSDQLSIDFKASLNLQQGEEASSQVTKLFSAMLYPGKVTPPTNLVIYNPVFGGDPQHLFHILSQVKFNIAVAPYLQNLGVIFGGSGGGLLSGLDISGLKVNLNNPQTIGIDTTVAIKNVTIPAEIKLNYVGLNLALNTVGLAQVAVPQFTLKPINGALSISAHLDIEMSTSKELNSAINNLISATVTNKTIPATNLVLSGLVFGGSQTNVFTILQGLVIPIDVSTYAAKLGGIIGGAGSLLSGLGLSGLAIDLNQAPNIGIDATIALQNFALPAELTVGYVGLSMSANNVPLAKVGIPKIQLGTSGASLTIATHVDIALEESDNAQNLAAGLVNALVVGQAPQGTVVFSGLTFGPSEGNVYTFLQGIQIPIPVSSIISVVNPATGGGSGAGTSFFNKLSLQSADINMKNPPSIGADFAVAILGYQFDARLLLNYVSLRTFLDTTPLATVSVPGIALSSGNNQIALKANALLNLASGSDIQVKIAAIAAEAMGNSGGARNVNLVLSNIAFGGGADKVFHILDKVKVSVPIGPYIQQLAVWVGGIFSGGSGNSTLSISQLDITAPSANELSVAVGAAIGGIGSKISVEMPYIGLQVSANGNGFVYPAINDLQLANGKVSLTLALPFQPAAKNIISSLSTPISQLLFSTVGNVPGSLVINSVNFGASAGQSFDLASKIGLTVSVNSIFQYLQSFTGKPGSLQLSDVNTLLTATGVQASLAVSGASLDGLPLKLNFPISLAGYYKNDTFATADITSMDMNRSPWSLGTTIRATEPAAQPAVSFMITNSLQGKDVVQDITLRGINLGSCNVFTGLTIYLPAIVSDSSMSATDVKTHLSPLSADFSVTYPNKGPLRVDMGPIHILIKQGPTTDVMEIYNTNPTPSSPIHINNFSQNGGNNQIPMVAMMKFSFFEFFGVLAGLMNPGDRFQFEFSVKTSGSGEEVGWLRDGLNGVSDVVWGSFLPGIAKNLVF